MIFLVPSSLRNRRGLVMIGNREEEEEEQMEEGLEEGQHHRYFTFRELQLSRV